MKRFKKLLICLLLATMMVNSIGVISIHAAADTVSETDTGGGAAGYTVGGEEEYMNLALNTTVTIQNGDNSENGAHIVDGDEKTTWETSLSGSIPTIIVDLGADKAIDQIVLKWANNYAFKYKLYLAAHKANAAPTYALALFHEEGMGGDDSWEMPKNTKARYIKIELIEAREGANSICLKELEVLKEVDAEAPINIALNKDAYASANEANLERLGPKGAFDGNLTDMTNGRWSSGNITKSPQWIYVDLGAEMKFDAIHILWQSAFATKYELQYSDDLEEEWQTLVAVDNGQGSWEKHTFYAVTARYVRLYATESNGVGNSKPISIMEMEIYQTNSSLGKAAKELKIEPITAEMKSMPVYTYDNGNIVAEIFCSDTDFVVEDDGTIHTPLVDKEVLVTYLLRDLTTGKTEEVRNIPVTIPGKYQAAAGDNVAPITVPSIQEWKGTTGTFQLTSQSRIVLLDSDLQKAAEITKADILDLFGLDLPIVDNSPKAGDIVLTKEGADQTIGDQGYTLDIDQYVTIKGTTYQAVFFGTRSVLQALESSGNLTIAKGTARDYAKYEHRKFMLDVARKYIPMWYLEDLVKYAAWYKFTDIQIHLNDASFHGYSGFRLESDIEGLTSTDGYYTKDEYREFQYYAKDYGITIISEFDTPSHSGAFIKARPDLALVENGAASTSHLDIRSDSAVKDDVYKFVAELFDEYMGGDDPVIVTEYFNVGLDEYPATYKEDLTRYTKYVMELVHGTYNKTPMAWASLGCTDSIQTKLPDYPIMDAWANYSIPFESLFTQGYQLINASNKYGYIVPGGNNGYPDFANEEEMYNELTAGRFRDSRKAVYDVAEGHPQIVGGSISLWNDRGIYNGISVFDIFERTKSIVPIYAQTFWYGKDNELTYEEFKENVDQVGVGANITANKEIESESDQVYDFDMENITEENDRLIIRDATNNHYDAVAVNATLESTAEGQALKLNGDGYLQMQHTALKWPYTIVFDLKIDNTQSGDIILFEEIMPEEECNKTINTNHQTRRIYLKETDGKYQLMYDRENCHFEHNVLLEKGQSYRLALTSDEKYTEVYVNGRLKSTINGPVFASGITKWADSASMYLPLQKLGVNLVGTLDNIKVYNRVLEGEEIAAFVDYTIELIRQNIALNKEAAASSSYNAAQTPNYAFDGDTTSNASRWASLRTHDQWIQVDLGDVYKVDQVKIYWESAKGVDFQILGSFDGDEWFEIKNVTNNYAKTVDYSNLGNVETRYVKMLGTKAYNNAKYGYSIYEFEVYESPKNELLRTIKQNKANVSSLSVGKYQGQIDEAAYQEYMSWLEQTEETVLAASAITEAELLEYKGTILQKYTALKKQIVKIDKTQLENAIASAQQKIAEGYNEQTCTASSWNVFAEAKEEAEKIFADYYVTQEDVDSAVAALRTATEALAYNTVIYTPVIDLPANAPLNTTIDFDFGKTFRFINGNGGFGGTEHPTGDISDYCDTSNTKFSSYADYATGNWVFHTILDSTAKNYYAELQNRSWLAIEDVNKKLAGGDFTVSADMYVPTGATTIANDYPLFRWTRSTITAAGGDTSYPLVSLNMDGSLVANGADTGTDIPYDTWFNITAKVKYLGRDNYRVSLYLDNVLIYTYELTMTAGEEEASYIIFFARRGGNEMIKSRLDNLRVYEEPDILDTTIDFDFGTTFKFINGNGGFGGTEHPTGDISDYCDTSNTKFSSYADYATGNWVFHTILDSTTKNYYAELQNRSWLAIEDVNKKLAGGDFTVSADMYVPTGAAAIANDYPLFRWTRSTITAEGGDTSYSLVSLNKDGSLVADGKDTGTDIPYDTWFNITAKVKYLGRDNYRVSLYLDNVLIYTYELTMTAGKEEASYIIFFARRGGNEMVKSRLDNLRVYEEIPVALELDFNGDYTSALNMIGTDNYFPTIGEGQATVQNGYLRIDHNDLTADQKGYIVVENDKFIGYDKYLIEADFRYSSSGSHSAYVATVVTSDYTSAFTPVEVKGTDNTLYASIGSAMYDLCTKNGEPIKVKTTSEEGFTKVAILVDESGLTYTVYVNGAVAYYKDGDTLQACVALPIVFSDTDIEVPVSANYASQLRLLEIHESRDNNCTLDISRLAVKALPSGISSSVIGTQTRRVDDTDTYDVRFVSGIDSLYGTGIGFEITAVYEDENGSQTKKYDLSSRLVFSSIDVDAEHVYAHELGCEYLATIQVVDIPMETTVTFTATPYVNHGGVKIYGEAFSETFSAGEVTDKPDDEYDIEFDEGQVEGDRNYAFNYTFDNVTSLDAEAAEGFKLSYSSSYPFELVSGADGYIRNTNKDGHLMIEDTNGVLNGKSFIVEAEISFTSLPESKDNGQYPIRVLRWIRAGEDQGTSYNHADEAFRIDADGKVYFKSTTEPTDFVLKANEKYTIKAYYTKDGQLKLLINGEVVGTKKFLTHDTISGSHLCLMDVTRATFDVNIHSFCAYYSDMSQFLPDASRSLSEAVSKVTTDTVYFEAYTDKDALSYEVNEDIKIEVYLMAKGEVVSVPYFYYTVEGEDGKEKTEAYVDGSKGHFSVTTSMSKEGHALVTAYMCDENKNIINGGIVFRGGAIVGVSEITRGADVPEDLEEYWSNVVAECYADETINLVRFDEMSAEDYSYDDSVYKLYLFEIGYDDGKIATGYISYPIGKDSLGIRMRFRGYGYKGVATPQFSETEVYIDMAPHGFSLVDENPEYPDENYGFDPVENQDPDTVYFHEMFTRNILGARFLKAFAGGEEYGKIMLNGEQIQPLGVWEKGDYFLASGGSQGGFQAMAVGALDDDVTDIYMGAPWFSDIGGQNIGRFPGTLKPAYTDALMYYDCSSLATLVDEDVKAILTAGLGDRICPPSGIITVYNALNCKKSISVTQNGDHAYTPPVAIVYVLKNH